MQGMWTLHPLFRAMGHGWKAKLAVLADRVSAPESRQLADLPRLDQTPRLGIGVESISDGFLDTVSQASASLMALHLGIARAPYTGLWPRGDDGRGDAARRPMELVEGSTRNRTTVCMKNHRPVLLCDEDGQPSHSGGEGPVTFSFFFSFAFASGSMSVDAVFVFFLVAFLPWTMCVKWA